MNQCIEIFMRSMDACLLAWWCKGIYYIWTLVFIDLSSRIAWQAGNKRKNQPTSHSNRFDFMKCDCCRDNVKLNGRRRRQRERKKRTEQANFELWSMSCRLTTKNEGILTRVNYCSSGKETNNLFLNVRSNTFLERIALNWMELYWNESNRIGLDWNESKLKSNRMWRRFVCV